MTKEEILEKSRKENRNMDIADFEIQQKASKFSILFVNFLCLIILIVRLVMNKPFNCEILMFLCGSNATLFITKYILLRKKHELLISILYAAGFLISIAAWIKQLIG